MDLSTSTIKAIAGAVMAGAKQIDEIPIERRAAVEAEIALQKNAAAQAAKKAAAKKDKTDDGKK